MMKPESLRAHGDRAEVTTDIVIAALLTIAMFAIAASAVVSSFHI
jgi:hypothetical protein